MLRKHMNALPRWLKDEMPFYSWNCITIQLGHRDVDLVIRSDQHMRNLIAFLVSKL